MTQASSARFAGLLPKSSVFSLTLFSLTLLGLGACATNTRVTKQEMEMKSTSEENEPEHLTLLFAADLHGQIEAHPELFWHGDKEETQEAGGFARVAAAVADIKAERGEESDRVYVIDGGDTLQGSGIAALTKGSAVVGPLNSIGFDLGLPGNWEVVYGGEILKQRAAEIRHPLIASNLWDAKDDERLFPPYATAQLGGVKLGIIGYTDPDVPRRQPPAYSEGLRYTGEEEIKPLIRELKEEHEVDVVILLSHIGLAKAVALAERLPEVSIHLSSDTHERTYEPVEAVPSLGKQGPWVVEPGAFGSFLGRLDLWVQGGEIVDRRWELLELRAGEYREDPQVKAVVEQEMAAHREELEKPVGSLGTELARYSVIEASLDNVLADALRDATGTDVAISNGFRFGTPIPAGVLREKDLWNFFPIVTPLKTGKVTGKQLGDFWEQELENVFSPIAENRFGGWLPRPSGMSMRFEASAPRGQRLRELKVGGKAVEDERLCSITSCEREGDRPDSLCRMVGAVDTKTLDFDAHEAVRRYLAKHPEIKGQLEGRVVGLDLPQVLRSQEIGSASK